MSSMTVSAVRQARVIITVVLLVIEVHQNRSAWRQDVSELHDLSTAIVRAERQRPNPAKRVGSGLRSAVTLP